MRKISTMRTAGKNIFHGQLTVGLDLGDRSSAYCVLDGAGEILLHCASSKLSLRCECVRRQLLINAVIGKVRTGRRDVLLLDQNFPLPLGECFFQDC